jgi:hypothetical protein
VADISHSCVLSFERTVLRLVTQRFHAEPIQWKEVPQETVPICCVFDSGTVGSTKAANTFRQSMADRRQLSCGGPDGQEVAF